MPLSVRVLSVALVWAAGCARRSDPTPAAARPAGAPDMLARARAAVQALRAPGWPAAERVARYPAASALLDSVGADRPEVPLLRGTAALAVADALLAEEGSPPARDSAACARARLAHTFADTAARALSGANETPSAAVRALLVAGLQAPARAGAAVRAACP